MTASIQRIANSRWLAPATALLAFATMGILYAAHPELYGRVITWWIVGPGYHPFIDWEWIPSSIDCWRQGVDVYRGNTCYHQIPFPYVNKYVYSPLLLRAEFLVALQDAIMPVGALLGGAFLVSLAALPAPRTRLDVTARLLATLSSLTAFAVERANSDLVVFVLLILAIRLWSGRTAWRFAGYAVIIAAGLLKFYPFIALVIVLFERPRIIAGVTAIAAAVVAIFVARYAVEFREIAAAIPTGSYFLDMIGARNLIGGLTEIAVAVDGRLEGGGPLIPLIVRGGAYGLALITIGALARRLIVPGGLVDAIGRLPRLEGGFLLAGSALVCGCFFTAQSIGYRGILLLIVMPGLAALAAGAARPVARAMRRTLAAIVCVMWVLTILEAIKAAGLNPVHNGAGSVVGLLHWLAHELAWWWIVCVLCTIMIGFALVRFRGSQAIPMTCSPSRS